MPYVFKQPHRPESWRQYRGRARHRLALPFLWFEWLAEWAAWILGRWALLEVLEYCGTLSILVGVIFYFAGAHDRREQKHFQAWQVINTAQGKGGSGGRIDALQDLNADRVALVGVDLTDAFLQYLKLPGANLQRATLNSADMRGANFQAADLRWASFVYANLRGADLLNTQLSAADFTNADLNGADLRGADFDKAVLDKADLRNADLDGILNWQSIKSIKLANILGCKNAPPGFRDWALAKANGAVELDSDDQWNQQIQDAGVAATRPAR